MKKYCIFFIVFLLTSQNIYSANDDFKKEYEHAFQLGNMNKLEEAFKEFSYLCDNKNFFPACLNKADYLRYGQGTDKNIESAIKIYKDLAEKGYEYALLHYGTMLEYEYGSNLNNINEISDIYNKLANSTDQDIREQANQGLIRLCTMYLYYEYLNAYYEFYHNKISYNAFENKLNSIDLNGVIPYIKDKFISYRSSLLKEAKHIGTSNSFSDSLLWSTKNMAKLLSGDFNPLADIPDAYMNRDNLKQQRKAFINAYSESNLSESMYEAMLNEAKQK